MHDTPHGTDMIVPQGTNHIPLSVEGGTLHTGIIRSYNHNYILRPAIFYIKFPLNWYSIVIFVNYIYTQMPKNIAII